jgi:hypothetical protein
MRYVIFLFLLVTLTMGMARGQDAGPTRHIFSRRGTARPARSLIEPPISFASLNEAADEIFRARPEITDDTLTNDAEVIEASLAEIQKVFSKRGFSPAEVQQAALSGWKFLRIKKLAMNAALSATEFVHCVNGLARLIVTTTPEGASVWLDYEQATDKYGRPEKTELCKWPSSGTHHIKLVLPGYEPVEEDLVVNNEDDINFDRKLKPIEKKNPQ